MFPVINGKSLLECVEDDLQVLIENRDFRENEYMDYKKNFSFLEIPKDKKEIVHEKVAEFKNDVCSFANAAGGYLVFGISDENGCASEIVGVDIPNHDIDRFELDRRNNLNGISPKTPELIFHFIPLRNEKYVVIIFVKNDAFAPYMHIVNERDYKIYKRYGNRKEVMTYLELRNMFIESISLEKEINNYRLERIRCYNELNCKEDDFYSKYLLVHIIPESFLNLSYRKNMFIEQKKYEKNMGIMFNRFYCMIPPTPCVDGIRYIGEETQYNYGEGYIYNNRIVEGFLSLSRKINVSDKYPTGFLAWSAVWECICDMVIKYYEVFTKFIKDERVFICLSIIGCKGVITEDEGFWHNHIGEIDRNQIMCDPVCIEKTCEEHMEIVLKKLYIEYLLAIGIKHDKGLNDLIKEVYDV